MLCSEMDLSLLFNPLNLFPLQFHMITYFIIKIGSGVFRGLSSDCLALGSTSYILLSPLKRHINDTILQGEIAF